MNSLYNKPGLLLALASLFWAGNFIVGRAVVGVIPPVTLATLRWVLAFLIFLPFAWPYLMRDRSMLKEHWGILVFLGVIGPGCYNTLSYMGLVSTDAVNAFMLNAAGPLFIAFAAWALFSDRVTKSQWAGLLLGFLGVIVILLKGDLYAITSLRFNAGDLLLIAGLITWAVYTAFLRKRPSISWLSFNAVTYGISGFGNVPFALLELSMGYHLSLSESAIAAIFYVAVFPSLLAYICYNRGVELLGAAGTAPYLFLITVFGTILSVLLLNEHLHRFHIVGCLLIAGGIITGIYANKFKGPSTPSLGQDATLVKKDH